jgi:hypothetical protein
MPKLAVMALVLCASSGLYSQTAGRVPLTQDSVSPKPVRNNVAQPGEQIITIRYFRIKKGTFDQFLKASQEDVWPFFDKIGARVIGMWKVFPAEGVEGQAKENPGYDEVYLSTRYASLDHWKATRDPTALGGNGPDWEKCQRGLALRQSLTISTNVIFLEGAMAANQPLFMPGLKEDYAKKP